MSLGLLAATSMGGAISSSGLEAQPSRPVRTLHAESLPPGPIGMCFSPSTGLFYLMTGRAEAGQPSTSSILALTPGEEAAGEVRLPFSPEEPINFTCDSRFERVLALDAPRNALLAMDGTGDGLPNVSTATSLQIPPGLALRPQGLAADPETGTIFILDSPTRRIVRIVPDGAGRPQPARTSFIPISGVEGPELTGLALDRETRHLYLISRTLRLVYEVDEDGRAVAAYDVARAGLKEPGAMVFAPSGDLTDDPEAVSLYVADMGGAEGQPHAHITEISLAQPELVSSLAPLVGSTLVRAIATSSWSPPSPDPSGLTYDSARNRLIVTDGEVEEMSIWRNVNYFEATLSGSYLAGYNLVAFSDEPVGVAFNPLNGFLFISDDDARRVYVVNKGPDGTLRTSDDVVTSFSTTAFGSGDPEGVTFDHVNNRLFIADGVNAEIYQVLPGPNGRFDGVPSSGDDVVSHFDTSGFGVLDPETVEFNAASGTLFTIGHDGDRVVELTTTGTVVREIDTSYIGLDHPSGLAYAPGSVNPSARNIYISDRHADNDSNPQENDGRIYEITTGDSGGGGSPNDYRVAAGSDDAEEDASGSVDLVSSDIELVFDGTNQTVGLRFTGVAVPRGASISSAYVQFQVDEPNTGAAPLTLRGQASDNAATFTTAAGNISSRPRTAAAVAWSPPDWTSAGEAGSGQRTPNLSSIVQEIVARPGWSSGNALALIITGSGERTAESYEGTAAGAAVLHVEVAAGAANQPPNVSAGSDQTITLPAGASLNGTVSDDGLPSGTLTTAWTKVSGPGTVTFGDAGAVDTTATFSSIGAYVLRLAASDGAASASDDVQVTVNSSGVNFAPTVSAGPDQTITLPSGATLDGTVADDGLPSGTLTTTWAKVSGPGTVTFGSVGSVDTTATFSAPGIYALRLTASDGAASASDEVQVVANSAPSVSAGPDQVIRLPASAILDAAAADDGLPSGTLATTWSKVSGPGGVTFGNAGSVDTTAAFSAAGVYVLRLTGSDGVASASDDVRIYVRDATTGFIPVDVRVGAGSDDAEQRSHGQVNLSSGDLQMVVDSNSTQQVGIRFASVPVLPGAVIRNAYVQFQADEVDTGGATLVIQAQAADSAPTFSSSKNNISSRTKTSLSVSWSPGGWTAVGAAGSVQRTPDLTSIIQQVVGRPGWSSGNALVLIVTGSGRRTAESYEGAAAGAPLLHLEYE